MHDVAEPNGSIHYGKKKERRKDGFYLKWWMSNIGVKVKSQYYSAPKLFCNLAVSLSTLLFSLFPLLER